MSVYAKDGIRRAIKPAVFLVLIMAFASGCNLPGQKPFVLPTATLPPPSETPAPSPTTAVEAATATATLLPTETSTPTPLSPVVINDTLCYNGPGKVWGVISSLRADTNVVLIGKGSLPGWWILLNPTYNQPCWIADADLKIDPSYDATALQVYDVPPIPVNLVPSKLAVDPNPPNCMDEFMVSVNVTNKGTEPTISGGSVSAVDRRSSNGSKQGSASGSFPVLKAGETYKVQFPMTVSKWWGEQHQLQVTIDPDNKIRENNDSDNIASLTYTLQQGSCP